MQQRVARGGGRLEQGSPGRPQRDDTLLDRAQPRPLARDAGREGRRQGRTAPVTQLGDTHRQPARFGEDDAVQSEESFDAVDLARALPRQCEELTVQLPPVLVRDTGHVQDAPDPALTLAEQEPYERGRVEPVGLSAPRAAVLGDACRVDDVTRDAAGGERAMEPEAVTAGLVAAHDWRVRREAEPGA